MNIDLTIKLMGQHGKCIKCGNEYVGDKEGTCEVKGNRFTRTCKCGLVTIIKDISNDE